MDLRTILQQYKKPLIVLLVIAGLACAGLVGYNVWRERNYAELVIEAAPLDLTMRLDNKEFKSPKTIYVKPGDYTLEFYRLLFDSDTRKVTAEKGEKIVLNVPLYPSGEEGKKYVQDNLAVGQRLELIGGRYEDEQTAKFTQRYPVASLLPVLRRDFKIDYSTTDEAGERKLYIRVTYAGKIGKKNAETWFSDNGFNIADYDVGFVDISKIPTGHD